MLKVTRRLQIPMEEIEFSFARSGGPGGQNVNKTNTKATLHWPIRTSESIPPDVRGRFMEKFGNRVNKEGQVVIQSQRHRDQGRNVADCLDKLRGMLLEVATPPKRRRRRTRPSRRAQERRLNAKSQHAQKKQRRRPPRLE